MTEPGAAATGPRRAAPPAAELTLAQLDTLPTLAPVAVRVLEVAGDRDSDVADVVRLVECDAALTAKILAVANSASRGARDVSTLPRAVIVLGFSAIRSIVLAVKVFECLGPGRAAPSRLDRAELWRHSLAVGCAARRLALLAPLGLDAEEAFVAGLLHDLGKLALDAVFPKAYERIAARADQLHGDIAECERETLGVDHTIAGRTLAQRWRLPRALQEVIWLHHLAADGLPSSAASPRLIGLVSLADTLTREQRLGYSGNHVIFESSAELAGGLGVSAEHLEQVVRSLVDEVSQRSELLGLGQDAPGAVYLKSLERANGELGRLNAELSATARRSAAAARYFQALTELDGHVSPQADLPELVSAAARAAARVLQRPALAAFALRDQRSACDVAWVRGEPPAVETRTVALDAPRLALLDGLGGPGDLLRPAPAALRGLLGEALPAGRGAWLMPIVHQGVLAGGLVYASGADEAAQFAEEADELRAFLGSLGLAIARVNAQAASRRLSDELADTNRRLQQMRGEVLRNRTLAMTAELASWAGHELNSPLSVISGRCQMLIASVDDPALQQALGQIVDKAHECSRIVSELIDFADPPAPRPESTDLRELLARLEAGWPASPQSPGVTLSLPAPARRGEEELRAWVDAAQIETVLTELLANARQAIEKPPGQVSVTCGRTTDPAWVQIDVRDDGVGMSAAVLARAFDPFFSQARGERRRGLGLPRALRLIEANGGRIWLESHPGRGTTARLVLPAAPHQSRL